MLFYCCEVHSCYLTVVIEILLVPSVTGLLQKKHDEINNVNPSIKTGRRRIRSLHYKNRLHYVNFYTSIYYRYQLALKETFKC